MNRALPTSIKMIKWIASFTRTQDECENLTSLFGFCVGSHFSVECRRVPHWVCYCF